MSDSEARIVAAPGLTILDPYQLCGLRAQPAVPSGDGCDKSLNSWFADWILRLKIPENSGSAKGLKLKDLPPACAAVLNAPASPTSAQMGEPLDAR